MRTLPITWSPYTTGVNLGTALPVCCLQISRGSTSASKFGCINTSDQRLKDNKQQIVSWPYLFPFKWSKQKKGPAESKSVWTWTHSTPMLLESLPNEETRYGYEYGLLHKRKGQKHDTWSYHSWLDAMLTDITHWSKSV